MYNISCQNNINFNEKLFCFIHIQERNNSAQLIVKKGCLDKIADYILDGKHEKLVEMKSDIPAVQDFLDRIPFYAVCV